MSELNFKNFSEIEEKDLTGIKVEVIIKKDEKGKHICTSAVVIQGNTLFVVCGENPEKTYLERYKATGDIFPKEPIAIISQPETLVTSNPELDNVQENVIRKKPTVEKSLLNKIIAKNPFATTSAQVIPQRRGGGTRRRVKCGRKSRKIK